MNSPAQIAELYSETGTAKTRLPFVKMFVLAVFAGIFISLGALGSSIVSCGISVPALSRLLSAVIFPIGLVMVVVAGSELFTGNCLLVISVLDRKATIGGMFRNLVVVWIGNFAGSLFIALLVCYGHVLSLYDGELAKFAVATAISKVHLSFGDAFIKGILCNIMVCVAVWMTFAPKQISGKILAAFLPIMIFVLAGFEHCVANFYFISVGILASSEYGIEAEGLSWLSFFVKNEIPVTLGNITGGILIGFGYWFIFLKNKNKGTSKNCNF